MVEEITRDWRVGDPPAADGSWARGGPDKRHEYLAWLPWRLGAHGLRAEIVAPSPNASAVLRVNDPHSRRTRFIACVPAPGDDWAFVWSNGWARVGEPLVTSLIVKAMES
jgi:hypothetical protein